MECPICKKEFNEKTGRRPKKFCSDACKVKWWNLQRAIKKEDEADEKLKKEIADDPEITEILKEINTIEPPKVWFPHYDGKKLDQPTVDAMNKWKNQTPDEEIQKQIAIIKAEKIPPHRDTTYGRKVWANEQQQRIDDLLK